MWFHRSRSCLLYPMVAVWPHSSFTHRKSSIISTKSTSLEKDKISRVLEISKERTRTAGRLRKAAKAVQRNPSRSLGFFHSHVQLILIAYSGRFCFALDDFWTSPWNWTSIYITCMTYRKFWSLLSFQRIAFFTSKNKSWTPAQNLSYETLGLTNNPH